MATLIGKPLGKVTQIVTDKILTNSTVNRIAAGPANKLWRAAILLSRVTGPKPKLKGVKKIAKKADNLNKHYAKPDNMSKAQIEVPWLNLRSEANSHNWDDKRVEDGKRKLSIIEDPNIIGDSRYGHRSDDYRASNSIRVVNNSVSPYQYVELQNRPWDMRVEPMSNWVSVKSMGRNNPFMVYTGGEDTITLEVSWYATDEESRLDVLAKCRLLESWTKADGYVKSPPVLNLWWGQSGMFLNDGFILYSAQYTLSNFQATSGQPDDYKEQWWKYRSDELKNHGMLPTCANQTLVFKRVSGINRTHMNMLGISALYKGPGIGTI